MTIDELKDKVKQFDAERLRIVTEINKRKGDLKRFARTISQELRVSETKKISNLEDILEDIEYDLSSCLEQLYSLIDPETNIPEADDMFETMLEDKRTVDQEYQTLVERRDQVMSDLETYHEQLKKDKKDLVALEDLIETTELELDEIIAELASYNK